VEGVGEVGIAGSFLMGWLCAILKLRLKFVSTLSTVETWLKVAKALLGLGAGRMWLELKVES
jgi:hypothetical protein